MGYSTKCYYCRLWDFKLVDVTISCYVILPEFRIFYLEMIPIARIWLKKSVIIENISFLDYRPNFKVIGSLVAPPAPLYAWNFHGIGITLMQNDLYKNYWNVKAEKHSNFHSFLLFLNRKGKFSIQRASGPEN